MKDLCKGECVEQNYTYLLQEPPCPKRPEWIEGRETYGAGYAPGVTLLLTFEKEQLHTRLSTCTHTASKHAADFSVRGSWLRTKICALATTDAMLRDMEAGFLLVS